MQPTPGLTANMRPSPPKMPSGMPPDGIPYRHHNREWHSNRECNGAMAKVFNDDFGTQFE